MTKQHLRILVALALFALVLLPTVAAAQPAPNRARDVALIVNGLPPAVETAADDARRALLYEIVRRLNAAGDCCWGSLVKTDQGGKIPADVIVWRPTLEHFDVLSGEVARPTWDPKGRITNPAWIWQAVDGEPPPPPPPPPPPGPNPDLAAIKAAIDALTAQLAALAPSIEAARVESYNAAVRALEIQSKVDVLLARPASSCAPPDWSTVPWPVYRMRSPWGVGTFVLRPEPVSKE